MSSAFIKESESEQLKDIAPNMASLQIFLKREYGNAVRELRARISEKYSNEVHEMSDGLSYTINDQNQWQVVLD